MVMWPHLQALPYTKETLSMLWSDRMIALATNAVDSNEKEIRQAFESVDRDDSVDNVSCY